MIRKKLSDTSGGAFVELAVILPVLTFLMIGAAEFGRIAYAAIEVSNAARAAVAYGSQTNLTAIDSAGMQTAASDDAPDVSSVVATSSTSCVCESITTSTGAIQRTAISICSGDSSTLSVNCPTSTTAGLTNLVVNYVQVRTQATVNTMFHYPGIPTSFTLHGFAKMRIQQD